MIAIKKITLESATVDELKSIIGPRAIQAQENLSKSTLFRLEEDEDLVQLYDALLNCKNLEELRVIKANYASTTEPLIEQHNKLTESRVRTTLAPIPQALFSNHACVFFPKPLKPLPELSGSHAASSLFRQEKPTKPNLFRVE